MGILVKIDLEFLLHVVNGDSVGRSFETEAPCPNRRGTIKIPPYTKATAPSQVVLQLINGNGDISIIISEMFSNGTNATDIDTKLYACSRKQVQSFKLLL